MELYEEPALEEYQYTEEADEYNLMIQSIITNKGFYVARYEAGTENEKAISKKGVMPWFNIPWGESMNTLGNNSAVTKAKEMYNDKDKYNVTSTLIYGIQWDAIMNWIDSEYSEGTCNVETSFVANSQGRGYFEQTSATVCGSSELYKVNNIYDLAGNLYEWTMESYNQNERVRRGSSYMQEGETRPASVRGHSTPDTFFDDIGFRVALYI